MAFQNALKWFPKIAAGLVSGMALLGCTLTAHAQIYSTTFNAPAYSNTQTLSGQNGWNTNDADNGVTTPTGKSIGQADGVAAMAGFSTGTGDYQGYLGGLDHTAVVPGTSPIYLYQPISIGLNTAYTFKVDFDISHSTTAYPYNDSFGWTFQNASGTNLFSVNFTPPVAGSQNTSGTQTMLNIGYSVGTTTTNTGYAMFSDSVYHLSVSVNVVSNTFTVSLATTNGSPMVLASNVPLGTAAPSTVTDVAATWILSNTTADATGGLDNAGSNALIFDNYAIVVPEPSVCILLGVSLLGVVAAARHRLRA